MKPNLARISADGDALARRILKGRRGAITASLLDPLDHACWQVLGRYGTRQSTVALRTGSAERLREALLATALAALLREDDSRDTMVTLALHVHVARTLGLSPAVLFDEVAELIPEGHVAALLRRFGARSDVTLEAFGWRLVDTPDGPDFLPV